MDPRELVAHYLCGKCEALLVKRVVVPYEPPRVVCASDPEHSGYIRKETVHIRDRKSEIDAFDVVRAYPQMRTKPPSGPESIQDLF